MTVGVRIAWRKHSNPCGRDGSPAPPGLARLATWPNRFNRAHKRMSVSLTEATLSGQHRPSKRSIDSRYAET
jgi:hypothetical protein